MSRLDALPPLARREIRAFLPTDPSMKSPLLPALACAGLLLVGCGSFEREWKRSVAEYRAGRISAPAGPWTGTWNTATNGHTGNLRAIVEPAPDAPGEYDFRYHATWAKIFSGAYTVRFPVKRSGGTYRANGEKSMGLFGTFGHKATINGKSFEATYSNDKGDLGAFSMRRPE